MFYPKISNPGFSGTEGRLNNSNFYFLFYNTAPTYTHKRAQILKVERLASDIRSHTQETKKRQQTTKKPHFSELKAPIISPLPLFSLLTLLFCLKWERRKFARR